MSQTPQLNTSPVQMKGHFPIANVLGQKFSRHSFWTEGLRVKFRGYIMKCFDLILQEFSEALEWDSDESIRWNAFRASSTFLPICVKGL